MGSGCSASFDQISGKDAAAIAAGIDALSAADRGILRAAFLASGDAAEGSKALENLKNIAENEAKLHELHSAVMTNKQGIYEARSMIEENRANILKNYSACFVGNRMMANENTDSIFKNRMAILDSMKPDGPVQENFINSKYNEAAIEYLENRSKLNNRVTKRNEEMSAINKKLIDINTMIMSSNEEIVTFNAAQIDTNSKLLEGIKADTATPEANAARIEKNKEKIANIKGKNDKYNEAIGEKHKLIKENAAKITENAAAIKARRGDILKNRADIQANADRVAALLRGSALQVAELSTKINGLSDEEKKSVKDALKLDSEDGGSAPDVIATIMANRKKISENEAALHKMHLDVTTNKAKLYVIRSIIEENRNLVLKNYVGAFVGNRQFANQNTDDIFKNRTAILDALKVEGTVQENFRNSKYNEANADFLEHRSVCNNRVAKVNELMSLVNQELIAVNNKIMEGNEEIVNINAGLIAGNKALLDALEKGMATEEVTAEKNAERVAQNAERIKAIADRTARYEENVGKMLVAALENRTAMQANEKVIDERRDSLMNNRANIYANGEKAADALKA
jgi:hypothetical protein